MDPNSYFCLQNLANGVSCRLSAIRLLLRLTGKSKLNIQRKIYMSLPLVGGSKYGIARCNPKRLHTAHALFGCSGKARALASLRKSCKDPTQCCWIGTRARINTRETLTCCLLHWPKRKSTVGFPCRNAWENSSSHWCIVQPWPMNHMLHT